MTVRDATRFVENEAVDGDGGAVRVSGTGVSLAIDSDVTFKGNVAGRSGGAIFAENATTLTVANAFFVENEAKDLGGGAVFVEVRTLLSLSRARVPARAATG